MSRGNIAAAHEARRIALAGYPTWVQITPDLHPVEAAIRYLDTGVYIPLQYDILWSIFDTTAKRSVAFARMGL